MKKLAALMLGLSLLTGSVAVAFAQEEKKSETKKKPGKKKGSKKKKGAEEKKTP